MTLSKQLTADGHIHRLPERRLIGQALSHWEALRGARQFPARADYRGFDLPFAADSLFLIRLGRNENRDRIVLAGKRLRDALAWEPVGRRAVDILPSSREFGLCLHRTAALHQKPTADVGVFRNALGHEVLYRCLLLPLSDNGITVDHVLGVFSFKDTTPVGEAA